MLPWGSAGCHHRPVPPHRPVRAGTGWGKSCCSAGWRCPGRGSAASRRSGWVSGRTDVLDPRGADRRPCLGTGVRTTSGGSTGCSVTRTDTVAAFCAREAITRCASASRSAIACAPLSAGVIRLVMQGIDGLRHSRGISAEGRCGSAGPAGWDWCRSCRLTFYRRSAHGRQERTAEEWISRGEACQRTTPPSCCCRYSGVGRTLPHVPIPVRCRG